MATLAGGSDSVAAAEHRRHARSESSKPSLQDPTRPSTTASSPSQTSSTSSSTSPTHGEQPQRRFPQPPTTPPDLRPSALSSLLPPVGRGVEVRSRISPRGSTRGTSAWRPRLRCGARLRGSSHIASSIANGPPHHAVFGTYNVGKCVSDAPPRECHTRFSVVPQPHSCPGQDLQNDSSPCAVCGIGAALEMTPRRRGGFPNSKP